MYTSVRPADDLDPYWTPEQRPATATRKLNLLLCRASVRVSEGTRTPDRLDHNQELYRLSYAHQGS